MINAVVILLCCNKLACLSIRGTGVNLEANIIKKLDNKNTLATILQNIPAYYTKT